jgi:choline dehydrogenase-like flavoprotein
VHPKGNEVCEAVLGAANAIGVPTVEDMNDMPAVMEGGMSYQPQTTFHGKRFSAARAFLTPVRGRKNLEVLPDTNVLKVEFEGKRATGVSISNAAGTRSVRANKEVILSAGAIQSPKLLQLSGIGPAALLQGFGIPVVVDAPNVGQNLREHRYLQTMYRLTRGSENPNFAGLRLLKSVLQYALFSSGPMTHAAHEVGGFVKTRPGLKYPDAQIGVGLYSMHAGAKGIQIDPYPGMTILGYFTRPESQGEIRIQSPDPAERPFINANHFSAEIDRITAVSLFRWLRELGKQASLRGLIAEETDPGAKIQTDEDILQNAVSLGGTSFHICGTCRMGVDEASVLDPQLRVRGVQGLRVVDTSIMPTIVSGNTNAPAMVVGLRAADFILGR